MEVNQLQPKAVVLVKKQAKWLQPQFVKGGIYHVRPPYESESGSSETALSRFCLANQLCTQLGLAWPSLTDHEHGALY